MRLVILNKLNPSRFFIPKRGILIADFVDCNAQKLELHNKEKLAKVLEDIRAKIISDDDAETVEGSGFGPDEQFVANLVVRPGFPVSQHKPKLEFMPHFEHENFEFMVPEGISEKSSVMAILPFYSILDSAIPEFRLKGNGSEYLEIDDLTVTQTDNYALVEVPIIKKRGINFPYGNGSYSLWITATQRGMENKAKLLIEVIPATGIEFLSIRPGSLELAEGEEYSDDIVGSGKVPENLKQGPPGCLSVVSRITEEQQILLECWRNGERTLAMIGIAPASKILPFDLPLKSVSIEENMGPNTVIAIYSIKDALKYMYKISGEDSDFFEIQLTESEVIIKTNHKVDVDYETIKSITLFVTVSDQEENSKIGVLQINVINQNDNYPVMTSSPKVINVYDHWDKNVTVGLIKASDLDDGDYGRLEYTMLEPVLPFLDIDHENGIIKTSDSLEKFSREEPYQLSVKVADHGSPAKSAITDIPVFVHTLIDSLNKQIQIISPSENCVIEISEDEKTMTTVFKAKAVLTGIEVDDALLKYYISSESDDFSSYFTMDEETGAMSLMRALDYEESAHFTVSESNVLQRPEAVHVCKQA
uniref:FRAS1-related extracellular matrix protein 2 n=1 Tax=Bursaphelenchus xylophilus TaxID=6326 RepID=A0A1I7S3G7_BURXY